LDLLLQSPIFINKFWNQKLRIVSKFDFQLNIGDFYMNFLIMSFKYKSLYMVFFNRFYIVYFLKSFLRIMFWIRKDSFWDETYLYSLSPPSNEASSSCVYSQCAVHIVVGPCAKGTMGISPVGIPKKVVCTTKLAHVCVSNESIFSIK
jgi:hypothetical protein